MVTFFNPSCSQPRVTGLTYNNLGGLIPLPAPTREGSEFFLPAQGVAGLNLKMQVSSGCQGEVSSWWWPGLFA